MLIAGLVHCESLRGCDASGGTVAVGNGGTIRDLFSSNPFPEVIFLKERFSKQGKLFIHLNNGGY